MKIIRKLFYRYIFKYMANYYNIDCQRLVTVDPPIEIIYLSIYLLIYLLFLKRLFINSKLLFNPLLYLAVWFIIYRPIIIYFSFIILITQSNNELEYKGLNLR